MSSSEIVQADDGDIRFMVFYLFLTERSEVCRVLGVCFPTGRTQPVLALSDTIPTKPTYLEFDNYNLHR